MIVWHNFLRQLCMIVISLYLCTIASAEAPSLNTFGGKVLNVPIQEKFGLELYQHWLDQALSSLMACVANKKLKEKSEGVTAEFAKCSKNAKNIPLHAKCVSRLLKDQIVGTNRKIKSNFTRLSLYRSKTSNAQKLKDWIENFHVNTQNNLLSKQKRPKRNVEVTSRPSYQLLTSKAEITPFGSVAKFLMKAVLEAKNKTETRPWQQTIERIKSSEKRIKHEKKRLEEESIENLDQLAFKGIKSHGFGEDSRDDSLAKMSDQEAEELQLHDDEGQMVNRKRHRNNDSATKLEAIKLARKYSIKSAAKKFDVTRSRIQEWMKQEDELKRKSTTQPVVPNESVLMVVAGKSTRTQN